MADIGQLVNRITAPPRLLIDRPPAQPPMASEEMIQAEARVWHRLLAPLEELIGDRFAAEVLPDSRINRALDEIDFGSLREFLAMVGKSPNTP